MAAGSGEGGQWAGIATSADSGATWKLSVSAVDQPSIRLVAYSADGSRMVAVGGGFAGPIGGVQASEIFLSGDSGASCDPAPAASASCIGAAMSADGCKLVGVYVDGLDFSLDAVVADLQSTPAPALAVASSGGSLFLSWVVPSIDFVLEQNADLGTTNWTDVSGTPVLDYSTLRNQVTVPAPAGPMFYRLISQ